MTHLLVGSAEWEVCPWKKRKCAQIWAEEASDSFDFLLVSAVSRKCDSDRAAAPLTSESILMCEEADKWRQEDTAPTQWTRDARPWWCSGWRTAAIEGFPSDVLIHLPSVWLIPGPPAQVYETFKESDWLKLTLTWRRAELFFICIFWMSQTKQEETQRPSSKQLLSDMTWRSARDDTPVCSAAITGSERIRPVSLGCLHHYLWLSDWILHLRCSSLSSGQLLHTKII